MNYETPENCEALTELSLMLVVSQAIGRRLVNEIHGEEHDDVRELYELLHLARAKLAAIQSTMCGNVTDRLIARELTQVGMDLRLPN